MEIVFSTEKLLTSPEGEIEECDFAGTVTIEVPAFQQRTQIAQKIMSELIGVKKPTTDEEKAEYSLKQMEYVSKGAELVMPYVKRCDLKGPEGVTLTTAEELYSHPDCSMLVIGLVGRFASGFLSKKSKPPSVVK